ncbi:MAG: hypothetical protein NVS9B13_15510 [Candidatus Acidiferrum sp.]
MCALPGHAGDRFPRAHTSLPHEFCATEKQAHGKQNYANERQACDFVIKVEAVIQPSRYEAVKDALLEIGLDGMTVTEVRGHGRQKGHVEVYRGREYKLDLLPKLKMEIVAPDDKAIQMVETIQKAANTGNIGDGKIFLTRVEDAIRIRSEERGDSAL